MTVRRKWIDDEIRLLVLWRGQSVKIAVIAKRLARSAGSVKQKLTRMRLVITPTSRRRQSGSLTRAVVARLKKGEPVSQIAETLGLGHAAVSRIRARRGYPPATRSERVKLSWVFRSARGDKPPNRWAKQGVA